MTQQPLDDLPILVILVLFVVVAAAAYESGFRIGRWRQARGGDSEKGPSGVLVGSLLALMAFLLAITMGMAGDLYNARRSAVLNEANAIGTTWLRAGYLPEPASTQIRDLIRQYVPLRNVAGLGTAEIADRAQRSTELQAQMWTIAENLVRSGSDSETTALFISSLNDTIDIHETRVVAGLYARVPPTILWLLFAGVVLTIGMVGYSAGLTGQRSLLTAIILVIALGAVIGLVIDLDRPQNGFITVSQQPLVDLQQMIDATPSP